MAAGACIDDGMAQVLSLPFCLQSCRTPTRISITAATSRYLLLSSTTPARRLPSAKHSHIACNTPRVSMLWGRLPARARGRLPESNLRHFCKHSDTLRRRSLRFVAASFIALIESVLFFTPHLPPQPGQCLSMLLALHDARRRRSRLRDSLREAADHRSAGSIGGSLDDLLRECSTTKSTSNIWVLQCPSVSRDAICIGPVPNDFSTLFKFVYQPGIGGGLLITFFSSVLQ